MSTRGAKANAKAAPAAVVHHGPPTKTKYILPPVEKESFLKKISSGSSPLKRKPNEEVIHVNRVVTDHAIITVQNKYGDSGFINNLKNVSMNSKIKETMNLIAWKYCHLPKDPAKRLEDYRGFPWSVAVVRIKEEENTPEGGQKILDQWVKLGNSTAVTKLNSIENLFIAGSDKTPETDDFLGNHLTTKDTLDIIRDIYVGYSDARIKSEPAIMLAFFGADEDAGEAKQASGNGNQVSTCPSNKTNGVNMVTDEDVSAFITSLKSAEH